MYALYPVDSRHDRHSAHDIPHRLAARNFSEKLRHHFQRTLRNGGNRIIGDDSGFSAAKIAFCHFIGGGRIVIGIDKSPIVHIGDPHHCLFCPIGKNFRLPAPCRLVILPTFRLDVEHIQKRIPPINPLVLIESVADCVVLPVSVRIPVSKSFAKIIKVLIIETGIFRIDQFSAARRFPVLIYQCLIPVPAIIHCHFHTQSPGLRIAVQHDRKAVIISSQKVFHDLFASQSRKIRLQRRIIFQIIGVIEKIFFFQPLGIRRFVQEMNEHIRHVAAVDQLIQKRGRRTDRRRGRLEFYLKFILHIIEDLFGIRRQPLHGIETVTEKVDDELSVLVFILQRILITPRAAGKRKKCGCRKSQRKNFIFESFHNVYPIKLSVL